MVDPLTGAVLASYPDEEIERAEAEALAKDARINDLKTERDEYRNDLDDVRATERALRVALDEAAQSLETIARGAGKIEGLEDMSNVRGYANSRASCVRAALRDSGGEGQASKDRP